MNAQNRNSHSSGTTLSLALALILSLVVHVLIMPNTAQAQCVPLETYKLLPDDGAGYDYFGWSVGASGTTAIVAAYKDDDNGSASGSAYLFDTTTGRQTAKLVPEDGARDDYFGYSVAISGTTAIIGAYWNDDLGDGSGSAYLFDTNTGEQTAKLLPDDGSEDDRFGISVAISGTTAIVGAYWDDDNGFRSGSAYLFDTTTGRQTAKLVPDDGAAEDFFGWSVGVSGTTAIVGAFRDDDNGSRSGSAYLFDTKTGQQIAKLLPDDGAANDEFGISVAVSGDTAIVGAHYDNDNGSRSGSAHLFDTTTGEQTAKLLPDDGSWGDEFGNSVALSGTTAIVGAYQDDDNGSDSGSAYIYRLICVEQCLRFDIYNLIAGEPATFRLIGGTPGARAVTVWGYEIEETVIDDIYGVCATFAVAGVKQRRRVIRRWDKPFDAHGFITFKVGIPAAAKGVRVFFQSAQEGTCPDECVSNVVRAVVQ